MQGSRVMLAAGVACVALGWLGVAAAPLEERPVAARQFLARRDDPVRSYHATRRLEASNARFGKTGWLEVETVLDPLEGFSWTVLAEGGSGYIRTKVLRRALEAEVDAIRTGEPSRSSVSAENYTFRETDGEGVPEGLVRLAIHPLRRDGMLLDGWLWLAADDADLLQIDGRLARNPSVWTRSVDVVRRYARVAGIRVPVEMTSTAEVLIAGTSHFRMTYTYQSVNGRLVDTTR
ncbi:MAG: hypothetical protein AB7H88_09790 [Vicinamibacterales bacterium]